MKLEVGIHGDLEISEAYAGFVLKTEHDVYGICERDGRIEINGTLSSADVEAAVKEAREEEREKWVKMMDNLFAESEGVAGLHRNGDVATWDELVSEGSNGWLGAYYDTTIQTTEG